MFKRHWPVIIGVVGFLGTVLLCYNAVLRGDNGHFVYVLDDPYIHMSIAKNVVQYGVWGVTRYGFTSCSSSPLWTLTVTALYAVFGVSERGPLVLNILIGIVLLVAAYLILRHKGIRPGVIMAALAALVFATPLAPIVFMGLEHTLHTLLSIVFAVLAARLIAENRPTQRDFTIIAILAPLMVMTRYEGMFLVLAVSGLLMLRGRPLQAVLLGVLGALPPVVYGLISVSNGWFFLPDSVLLKGNMPTLGSFQGLVRFFGTKGIYRLLTTPHLLALVIAALAILIVRARRTGSFWQRPQILTVLFLVTTALHVQFADLGWFHRYEAYLVGLGIVTIAIGTKDLLPARLFRTGKAAGTAAVWTLATVIVLAFLPRIWATAQIPRASNNIYQQQYQMGTFLSRYYTGETVVLNDIGAVSFLADVNILDAWGLASIDVARAMREGRYTSDLLERLAASRGAGIAVMYETLFNNMGGTPRSWEKVHEWWLPNNLVCGSNVVAFFSLTPDARDRLIASLRQYGK